MHNHNIQIQIILLLISIRMIQNIFNYQTLDFQPTSLTEVIQIAQKVKTKKKSSTKSIKQPKFHQDQYLIENPVFMKKEKISDRIDNSFMNNQYNSFLENEYFQNEHTYFNDINPFSNNSQVPKEKQTVSKLIGDIKKYVKILPKPNQITASIQNNEMLGLQQNFIPLQKKVKSSSSNIQKLLKKKQPYQFDFNYFQNQNDKESNNANKTVKNGQKKEPGWSIINKRFIRKRIHMCGQCFSKYSFTQQLLLHLNKVHKGIIPDGSIFGMKRGDLLSLFHIPIPNSQKTMAKRTYLYKCGCGKQCCNSSSLYYHIRAFHQGIQPAGTIGLTKRQKKLKNVQQ